MSASLIIIIQELQIQKGVQQNAPAPLVLHHFSVFSQWNKLPDDEGKTFEQRIAMALGNEKPVLENISVVQMTAARLHRTVVTFQAFPTLKAGEYDLTLSLRVQGESHWPEPIAIYPIYVKQVPELQTQVH